VLGERARGGFQDLAQMPGFETHPHAVHPRARSAEHRQAFVVVADVQAHFGQDAVGSRFDLLQVVLAQDVVGGDGAGDVGGCLGFGIRVAPLAAAAPAALLSVSLMVMHPRSVMGFYDPHHILAANGRETAGDLSGHELRCVPVSAGSHESYGRH
jgi:hypothetical protein